MYLFRGALFNHRFETRIVIIEERLKGQMPISGPTAYSANFQDNLKMLTNAGF